MRTPYGTITGNPLGITTPYSNNCVTYLSHNMNVRFPPGVDLTSYGAKQSIVNVSGPPRIGDVAVISLSPGSSYAANGHLALVTGVSSTSITIQEAHYLSQNGIDNRVSTAGNLQTAASQLGIAGYYRPPGN
jgi:hypothetical protein